MSLSYRRRFGLILAVMLGLLPAGRAAWADGGGASGLYVYLSQVSGPNTNWDGIYDDALARPYVDGAAIVIKWSVVEPRPGVYDWSRLDRWVVEVVGLKKKLALGVVAGAWAPGWLYAAGVPDVVFPSYDRSPPMGLCGKIDQPAVWNPVYLQNYDAMMEALSRHLQALSIPGAPPGAAYAALRVVKLSGINLTTEELRINAHPPGGPCHEADAAAVWARAGYRPQAVVDAFMNIARASAAAFPGKLLSVAIIHKQAFPRVDDDGLVDRAVLAKAAPDPMTLAILRAAVPVFGAGLMVQWNALSQFTHPDGGAVLPPEVLDAGAQGARVGWQLNGFLGIWGGTGCIYPPFQIRACKTIQDFQAILDNGIDHGADYLEIQPVTVEAKYLRLPPGSVTDDAPAYEAAHRRLFLHPGAESP